jgi:hypothetical protein
MLLGHSKSPKSDDETLANSIKKNTKRKHPAKGDKPKSMKVLGTGCLHSELKRDQG